MENMYVVPDENREAALKPVSCPAHLRLASHMIQSYRELPLRLAEFGVVHRKERSGSLHGYFRLRQFVQDDGHILCSPEDVVEEVAGFCEALLCFYDRFELQGVEVALSLRPEDRAGDEEKWSRAEAMLREGLQEAGLDYREQPGEGAFYGPKIEFALPDHQGRLWQVGTIQADLFMPERFGLAVAGPDDSPQVPVMLHRALFGSLERFLGILLEQHRGKLPVWLAPIQAAVFPVADEFGPQAERLVSKLEDRGLRVVYRSAEESLGRRIAEARNEGIPYGLIIGEREVASGAVAIRKWNQQSSLPEDEALELIAGQAAP